MKKLTMIMCVVAMGALLPACSNDDKPKIIDGIIIPPTSDKITLSRAEESVNDNINAFAFNFLNAAAAKYDEAFENTADGNMAVSPLSASMVLALTANAGNDELTESISKALGFDDVATLNSACNKLLRFLPNRKDGNELVLANSVWYDQSGTAKAEFVKNMNETFYAEVNSVDMHDGSTCYLIDKWCSTKTNGIIPSIMDELSGSNIILANAMYFNGKWEEEFKKSDTKYEDFHGTASTSTVRMMHASRTGYYYDLANAEAASIPFKGSYEMIFMLPKDDTTADELSKTLSFNEWKNKKEYETSIKLSVPSFEMETSANITKALEYLGVDFSYSSLDKMGFGINGALFAIQKTSTKVDESGATVAAVSAVGEYWAYDGANNASLVLDRPFLYFLRNTVTGSILIAGRINNLPNAY